ncbi:MAG: SpoIVB peptidase, partial [Lachnospiraceae bacterium]|nr:SpoIVB peptidase [Lachnospiraceae bacterium]
PVGLKQEIKPGDAEIICDINGERKAYTILINEVNYSDTRDKREIVFTVTDEELLSVTGGIVQGMSGAPMIQNGKIIGAVTHVYINDPTKGYGIFIEEMLEN